MITVRVELFYGILRQWIEKWKLLFHWRGSPSPHNFMFPFDSRLPGDRRNQLARLLGHSASSHSDLGPHPRSRRGTTRWPNVWGRDMAWHIDASATVPYLGSFQCSLAGSKCTALPAKQIAVGACLEKCREGREEMVAEADFASRIWASGYPLGGGFAICKWY